jgi:hypothetical protein
MFASQMSCEISLRVFCLQQVVSHFLLKYDNLPMIFKHPKRIPDTIIFENRSALLLSILSNLVPAQSGAESV